MTQERMSSDEVWRCADEWYDNHIRPLVETDENIGKLITLDVKTGEYQITTRTGPETEPFCFRANA